MTGNLTSLTDTFGNLRVLVIGEAMLDRYLKGASRRLCREAPVPIVDLFDRQDSPGGAANTAVNVRKLGGDVRLLSVVGDDAEGHSLKRLLENEGVSPEHLFVSPQRQTLAKSRVVAEDQLIVRFDQGTTGPIDRQSERTLIARLCDLLEGIDAVIVSDYGYGILTPQIIRLLGWLQNRYPRPLVVDSRRRLASYREAHVTAVKPNFDEAAELLGLGDAAGLGPSRADLIADHSDRALELTGARIVAVTLDVDGAVILQRGMTPYRIYARPKRQSAAAGAGDTFVATMATALAAGASAEVAAEIASAASAVVVGKEGTATCSLAELNEAMSVGGKFLADPARLSACADFHRRQGRRIVFTNGCFDILHSGHVTYLNRAKALGDVLFVGVNTDEGVARLKGPGRPINTLDDRIHVLAALSCVDHLVAFDEETPINLVQAIRPDVFVKGGDYTLDRLPEAAVVQRLGGTVHLLPLMENRSTTNIIERIRKTEAPETAMLIP